MDVEISDQTGTLVTYYILLVSNTFFRWYICKLEKNMCFTSYLCPFFDNQPNEHLQVWTTLVKTVGIIAIMVNVIGVAMLESVVGKDGLKMDVMAPLVGQIDMNVYWIQVKIFFLILEQKIYKNKQGSVRIDYTVCFIILYPPRFLLEIRVIIKISKKFLVSHKMWLIWIRMKQNCFFFWNSKWPI